MWRKRANQQQHLQLPTTTTNNHAITITTPTPTSNNNNNSQLQRQILSRATTKFANTTVAGAPIASVFNRRKHSVLTTHSILSHSQQQQHTQQQQQYNNNNNNNSNHNNENGNLMRDEDDEDDEFEILYDLDHHLGQQQHQQQASSSSSIQVSSSTKSLAHLRPFSLYENNHNNNNKSSSSSTRRSSDRIVMSNDVEENDIDIDIDDDESQALTMTLSKKNNSSREIQHSMSLISATPVSRLLSHDKLGHVSSDFNWFSDADVVEEEVEQEVEIDEEEEAITVNVQTERTRQKTAISNSGSESTRMVDVIQLMDDESSPVIVSQNISRVFSSASRVVAPSTATITTRVGDETKTTVKKRQAITREQRKRESKQRSRNSSGSSCSSSGEKTSSLILDSEEELMDHDDDEEDFDHFFGGSKIASDRGNHKGPRRVLDQDKRHAAILNRRRTFEDQDIEDDIGSFSDEEGEPLHDMGSTLINHSARKDIRNTALSSNVVEILSDSEDIGELADVFHRSRATTTNKKRLLSAPDAYAHVPSLISARNDRYKHIVHGKRVLDDEIEDISDDETNPNVVQDEIQDVVQDVVVPPSQPATQQSNKFTKPTKPTQFISTQPVASWLTSLRVASTNTIPLSTQGQENDMDVVKKIKSKFGYCGRLKQAVVDARNTIVTHDIQASEARRSSVMPTQTPSQILPALNSVVVRIIKDREEFSLYFATCLVLSSERSYGEYVDIVFTTATKNNMKLRPGRVVRIRGPFVDHSLYPRFSFVCSNATEERQFKDLSSASEINEQVESLIRKFTCAMVSEDGEL